MVRKNKETPAELVGTGNWTKIALSIEQTKSINALERAKQMEQEKINSGLFHFVSFKDITGRISRKLTRK